VSSEVPGAHPGGPRPLPPATDKDREDEQASADAERSAARADKGTNEGTVNPTAEPPTAGSVGDGEEVIELSDEEKAAVPARSDDQG
jgi:hypothetical protein